MKGFGVIGGGAVLFSASALAGQAILPLLGEVLAFKQLMSTAGSILNTERSANMLSILRSIQLGRTWRGWTWLGRGSDCKELLHNSILQVRQALAFYQISVCNVV